MRGLDEDYGFIILAIVAFFIYCLYRVIMIWFVKRRYKFVIRTLNRFGYNYYSYYNVCNDEGFIYRKQLDKAVINSLLVRYKYEPLELNSKFKVFDYMAIMVDQKYSGVNLMHFYTLEIQLGDKSYRRQFYYYLRRDVIRRGATEVLTLSKFFLKNLELIEAGISSDIEDVIKKFNKDEIEYWKQELLNMIKTDTSNL